MENPDKIKTHAARWYIFVDLKTEKTLKEY